MESPSPRYILTRAAFLITAIFVVLSGISFVKKKQRQSAIIAELKSISSDSSFFKQFNPEDAVDMYPPTPRKSDLEDSLFVEDLSVIDRHLNGDQEPEIADVVDDADRSMAGSMMQQRKSNLDFSVHLLLSPGGTAG